MVLNLTAGCCALIVVCMPSATAVDQTADQIVQKMRNVYGTMKSYADTGVIIDEYGAPAPDRHTFTTYFIRSPRRFLLDFHKHGGDRYVIWADPDAFHVWWKTTGQQMDHPNPENAPAISMSGPPSKSAALKIPTLLYSKIDLGGDFNNFANVALDGTENLAGHRCYRLVGRASDSYAATGKDVNVRAMTVWIDAESSLLRQVREDWKGAGAPLRLTTTFEPEANAVIDETKVKFVPPVR